MSAADLPIALSPHFAAVVARALYLTAFAAAAVGAGTGRAVTTTYLPVLLDHIESSPGLIGLVMLVNAGAGLRFRSWSGTGATVVGCEAPAADFRSCWEEASWPPAGCLRSRSALVLVSGPRGLRRNGLRRAQRHNDGAPGARRRALRARTGVRARRVPKRSLSLPEACSGSSRAGC